MDHTIAHTYLHTLLCSSLAHSHPFQITSSAHISSTSGIQSSGQQGPTPPPRAFSLLSLCPQPTPRSTVERQNETSTTPHIKKSTTHTARQTYISEHQIRSEQSRRHRHAHTPRPEQREAPTAPPFRRTNAFQPHNSQPHAHTPLRVHRPTALRRPGLSPTPHQVHTHANSTQTQRKLNANSNENFSSLNTRTIALHSSHHMTHASVSKGTHKDAESGQRTQGRRLSQHGTLIQAHHRLKYM